jgi:hypothetical protein
MYLFIADISPDDGEDASVFKESLSLAVPLAI